MQQYNNYARMATQNTLTVYNYALVAIQYNYAQ